MRRLLALFLVLASLLPTAASAQDGLPTTIEELQVLQATLTDQVDALTTEIAQLDEDIATLEEQLGDFPYELELLADEYARTVEARRAPALIFRQISIDAFMRGDPRLAGLLQQVASMRNDMTALVSKELYAAVIDGAIEDLEDIDARLNRLGREVDELRKGAAAAEEQLAEARTRREAAIAERAPLAEQLRVVTRQIERLRYFEDHLRLTGLPGENPARPALAVKIDNVDAARPQTGINQADVVFEEMVEGGVTRLAAVFHSTGSAPVGPVRSIRTTDVALLANLDRPLFSNSGGNSGALDAVARSSLVDIGHVRAPSIYYRDKGRRAPHNLYSTTDDLWGTDADRQAPPPPLFDYRIEGDPMPPGAQPSEGVDVNFPSADITYRWNGSGWARSQNGRPHVDTDGVQVAPANVIVQITNYRQSAADSRSPEAVVVGSGEAFVFLEGQVVRGTWSRQKDTDPTVYTVNGELISLTPGRTWVALAPPGSVVVR